MKTKFFRLISIAAIFTLMFQIISFGSANAKLNTSEGNNQSEFEVKLVYLDDQNSDLIKSDIVEPQWIQVAVFFGGMLMGYLVDGVIQYTTGRSAADWVSYGLGSLMESKIINYGRNLSGGSIVVSSTGSLSSCASFPCPIMHNNPSEE